MVGTDAKTQFGPPTRYPGSERLGDSGKAGRASDAPRGRTDGGDFKVADRQLTSVVYVFASMFVMMSKYLENSATRREVLFSALV